MRPQKGSFSKAIFSFLFLVSSSVAALAAECQLEMNIKVFTDMPGDKTQIQIQTINRTGENIRYVGFNSGFGSVIFLVDETGKTFQDERYCARVNGADRTYRRGYTILTGVNFKGPISISRRFNIKQAGLYYLVYAIPKPGENSDVFFSSPGKLALSFGGLIESCTMISVSELPPIVRKALRSQIETRLFEERIPANKLDLPF